MTEKIGHLVCQNPSCGNYKADAYANCFVCFVNGDVSMTDNEVNTAE